MLFTCFLYQVSAQTATVQGIILDDAKTPILGVNISSSNNGTETDINGTYSLKIPSNQDVEITYSHVGALNHVPVSQFYECFGFVFLPTCQSYLPKLQQVSPNYSYTPLLMLILTNLCNWIE